jgi:phenylacetate-CoA ligase
VLETAVAQLRYAASVVFGRPFSPWVLDRLIDGVIATQREFGALGSGGDVLGGPVLDAETRHSMQVRRFRSQAVRGARETAYYGRLFSDLGCDPARLRAEDIATIPPTPKEAQRADPDAFVRRTARPCFRTMTTGTTGRPTSVYFSASELRTAAALAALSFLTQGLITAEDVVHIGTSSRATLGNTCLAGACTRIGALWYQAGLIEPTEALALLAEQRHIMGKKPRASVLSTYPSYLGALVEEGQRLGYGPANFGLERIFVGGEVVTEGLKTRCRELFGPVTFSEGYAMTETWPMNGARCEEGHLHFEASQGLLEVLTLETATPAAAGEAGTIVATPFAPYREATVVLRYDTQDVVRPLGGPLTCTLRNLQATTNTLGKLGLAARHEGGWTFPRDILEALEAVTAVPLPARCGFWAADDGVAVEVVARADTPAVRRAIEQSLGAWGVPLRALSVRQDRAQLRHPLPLRGDLREISFCPPPPREGPHAPARTPGWVPARDAVPAGG